MQLKIEKNYSCLYDWGYNAYPDVCKLYIFSADITPEMLKLGRVTKVKVFFLLLVNVLFTYLNFRPLLCMRRVYSELQDSK